MIYLDNSATTQLDERVLDAMGPYLRDGFGNASSIYELGRSARIAIEDARAIVASAIGAEESEIVFTSGGTEANNHAIQGAVFAAHLAGRNFKEQSVSVSQIEHHAVLEPAEFVEKLGVKVHLIGVDSDGIVDINAFRSSLSKNTSLVSVMSVNNETGSINPIKDIASLTRELSPLSLIHTDAVQALGKIDINVKEWGVDLLSLSAHKIHGPKGIGALYVRRTVMIEPLLHGGAQERNRRGGTEAVALAVGFAKATEILMQEKEARREYIRLLNTYLLRRLHEIDGVVINSPRNGKSVDNIINITFTPEVLAKVEGDALIIRFDLDGIAVSNGSACTSGALQPSHVLLAMGRGEEVARKSIRVSLSKNNSVEDFDAFIETLKKIVQ
jgi:cysteine desulfurase